MIDASQIARKLARLPEVESALSSPGAAANQTLFRKLVQEHTRLKRLEKHADIYLSLTRRQAENRELAVDAADAELAELAALELAEVEAALPDAEKNLMVALLPPDPADARNAVVEVRAGTGGDEAALFAGDLFRMYSRYAEARGWKIGVVDASPSEIGGYKEIVFTVEGDRAYGTLRYEMGGHRVQRIPITEAQGRIHTSAATVAVFPEADEDDDIGIDPDDLRIDIYRSSGAGGQHVNTTDSAVRITHLPTGIVVQSQDERSQHRNREKAMNVLKARILDQRLREEAQRKGDVRRSQIGSGDRSERIRTYNFPQNRMTDHRIGLTLYSLDRIIHGDLEALMTSLRDHDTGLRLKHELEQAS